MAQRLVEAASYTLEVPLVTRTKIFRTRSLAWRAAGCAPRAAAALANAGIDHVEQIGRLGPDFFRTQRNCGPRTIAEIGELIGGWPDVERSPQAAIAGALRRAGYVLSSEDAPECASSESMQRQPRVALRDRPRGMRATLAFGEQGPATRGTGQPKSTQTAREFCRIAQQHCEETAAEVTRIPTSKETAILRTVVGSGGTLQLVAFGDHLAFDVQGAHRGVDGIVRRDHGFIILDRSEAVKLRDLLSLVLDQRKAVAA
jgi:hypothetical protein